MTKEQQILHTLRILKILNAALDMGGTITRTEFSDIVSDVLDDVRNEYSVDPRLLKRQCEECDLKRPCCDRVGEYNGLGRKGPLRFVCPKSCACYD